jgi:ubiquinone biosynthesis protein
MTRPVDPSSEPRAVSTGSQSRRRRESVIVSIPRRKANVTLLADEAVPAMVRSFALNATPGGRLGALLRLAWIGTRLLLGSLRDSLLLRVSMEAAAQRFRRALQSGGPTLIKIGQHLTVRADLLQPAYREALNELVDLGPPIPLPVAIGLIERATKRKVTDTFAVFDPAPIAATTVATVFQALLPDGNKVGIKVRRPDIGPRFAADLWAVGIALGMAELFGLLRQGRARLLASEFQDVLVEALNLAVEARYNEIFASKAKKKLQAHIQAPQVYFDLSNDDVLVTEFVSGVFLWELIQAVESEDRDALADFEERGIDPVGIAKRLTRSFYWEALENIFFHADPSPTKIVVRNDNTLVFIDFASCGRFSERVKRYFEQVLENIEREDVGGMVDATLSMLEPLPPIDLDKFTKEVEGVFWDWLYATKSRHSEWWERTSGELWARIIDVARRFRISVPLDVLRIFRATKVYDDAAMRMWTAVDPSREFRVYSRERGVRARREVRRSLRRRLERGPRSADYLQIEDMSRLLNQLASRGQHILDRPAHRFTGMVSKAAFGVSMLLRVAVMGAGLHLAAIVSAWLLLRSWGREVDLRRATEFLVYHPAYQLAMAMGLLVLIRRVLIRLEDIDVDR